MSVERWIFPALRVGLEWVEATCPAICYHLTIYAGLYRLRDDMKWRDFLSVPKKIRRTRSAARNEVGSPGRPSEADLVVPRPTKSTPDLGVDTSALPTPSSLIPHDNKSNGTQTVVSRMIHLTTLFRATQTPVSFPTKSHPFPEEAKATARNLWVTPLTQGKHRKANRAGAPPHTPQPN